MAPRGEAASVPPTVLNPGELCRNFHAWQVESLGKTALVARIARVQSRATVETGSVGRFGGGGSIRTE